MSAYIAAKLGDLDSFLAEFHPGDEKELDRGAPVIFGALSNTDPANRYAIASYLLDKGCLVEGANSDGDGALAIALSPRKQVPSETLDLVRRLIDAGADPAQRNEKGVTATQWVAQLKPSDDELAELLEYWFALPGLQVDVPNAAGRTPLDLTLDVPQHALRRRLLEDYRG